MPHEERAPGQDCADQGDDPTVADEEELWRRIHPEWVVSNAGGTRVSSAAFKESSGEISVDRANLTNAEAALALYPHHGLAAIEARVPRSLGAYVVRARPTPDNPAHAVICPRPTRGHARQMAGKCEWRREPPQQAV